MKTLFILVMLTVVAIALFALRNSNNYAKYEEPSSEETDIASTINEEFNIASDAFLPRIVIECEDAIKIEYPVTLVREPMDIASGASGGAMLRIGPEKINESEEILRCERGHSSAANPGYAILKLPVAKTGIYHLYVRAWWVDDCGNSVDVSIDGGEPATVTGTVFKQWRWNPMKDNSGRPIKLHLNQGESTLTLLNREDDLYLDQILLVDAKDRSIPNNNPIAPTYRPPPAVQTGEVANAKISDDSQIADPAVTE